MISLYLSLYLGCQSSSSTDDEWILQNLKDNPHTVLEYLHTIDDPLKKTITIMNLVERYPNRTRPLCDALPSDISLERCHRLTQRPHLWKKQRNHFPQANDTSSKSTRTCILNPHPNTCWTAQALADASVSLDKALDSCRQIGDQQWQAECHFTLAEHIGQFNDQFIQGLEVCTKSEQYQKSCWMHLVLDQAQQSNTHLGSWDWFYKIETAITTVDNIPPQFQTDLIDHFWAQSTWKIWESGNLSSMPPPPDVTQSTLRDLQSLELLRWCDLPLQNLDRWANTLIEGVETCTKLSKPRGLDLESDLWSDLYVPEDCTTRSFLGQSHRISCPENPMLDAKLSLLEVSVRIRPMPKTFLQESLEMDGVLKARAQALYSTDIKAPPDRR